MLVIRPYEGIISPCNGLQRCWRHQTGCARIVISAREEYAIRQRRKQERRWLWHIVLEHYRIASKWGLDPLPRRYHLQAILLMEEVLFQQKLSNEIDASKHPK